MSTMMLLQADVAPRKYDFETPIELLPEQFEIIDGQIVETPYMSDYADEVANRLHTAGTEYLIGNPIGAGGVERLFHIPQEEDEGRKRRPDWSFVSFQRWAKDRPYSYRGSARDVVPDITAEIVSPGDSAEDVIAKVREYLRGGVRLAWLVYPLAQEIHAYLPESNSIRVYFAADELEAGDILPGFKTSVAALFPPIEPTPPNPPTATA